MGSDGRPFVVGLGGTTRPGSSTEWAVRRALAQAAAYGARTALFAARDLELPLYAPERQERTAAALALVDALRRADGIIIGSPGYHGGVSGMVKNALDYVEDLRNDERPYFDGRAVGCIVCANGWQGTTTTLVALRSIVHALRGWLTPLGVAINSGDRVFAADGEVTDTDVARKLDLVGLQVAEFAWQRSRAAHPVAQGSSSLDL
ncbi:FMN reductase [Streptosporangium album]|uniref:FMN reductase n=1 Tax=Streptosporangium album TaxID=47479 RepID=A0A7W7WEI3_9ACTN|nr:NAD(P)H-dependent oxidoreductase [Streptosporangium album]MBB4944161.1 FMN reductase [Streptosporangium album]